jgi:hypothetical protein
MCTSAKRKKNKSDEFLLFMKIYKILLAEIIEVLSNGYKNCGFILIKIFRIV